ncbi:tetratricopeptide repeat protein 41-like isoform X1 [Psammomys obesus]|uniref:tetratricopeptide repeat protein 41-like isoform X1 n=1 Tax=Psammomys obesus TaxID=48139 RepID=UPI0024536789|nr:tetratricopeptide repeat protein 41-like isoform X1 [Psammomys obesus]XP_055483723.1 tetratricopeptide repeat protein 41-like isoform X1 [Psammomys obesus]XP_055483724.1 tetratricopeptide repeat protein 41-like isoform X1 [Psammomys obesus]
MDKNTSETGELYSTQPVLKSHKPIQPYICSTLDDFQEERDFLANNIFPRLNDFCGPRGTYFKAVDLRWSALKAHKSFTANLFRQYSCLHAQHLKLCLDYVNKCFPFFICLLGQTYGDFLPDYSPFVFSKVKDFSSLSKGEQNLYIAAKNGYPWVLKTPNCSLTEFEIIQAAFRKQSQFQFFYFRTSNALLRTLSKEEEKLSSASLFLQEGKHKVGKLKARIIGKGLPVRFYRDLDELGDLVFKDWSAVVEKLYPVTTITENIDYRHSFEHLYHEEFTEKCKQVFVISKESSRTFDILERFALKNAELESDGTIASSGLDSILRINSLPTYKSILLLSGERGCGKSTLIGNWVSYFKKKYPGVLLIPYFVGSSCESSDIMSVIHYFIMELQDRAHGLQLEIDFLNEDSNVLVFSLLVEVFMASISLKPCVLVLDGIEELIGIYGISGQKAKDFSWLPHSLPPHCKFILSTVSSSLSCKSLCARPDVRTVEFSGLGDEDTKFSIFRQHLPNTDKERFGQKRSVLRKKPNLNPLKLSIIARELQECRIYRNEFQCLREYLEVASVPELWELILKRWVEDYGWNLKHKEGSLATVASGKGLSGWVADALCLLCISHCGLAEDELLELLDMLGYKNQQKVTAVHWAAFRNATKHWIQEKPNGLLYFSHQSLRNVVEYKLLGVITPVRESSPNESQDAMNHKKAHFHQVLMRFFQRQTLFWRVYQELPWHMKMSRSWESLCGFITSPGITDFISKIQNPSLWTRLHLIHYWDVLLEAGSDVSGAFLVSAAKIESEQHQKMRKPPTLSVLECSLSQITTADKCRIILFIGSFLKFMGKINEAERLLLIVEDMLLKNPYMIEMLFKAQNAIGELYLEIGMTQKGLTYFQKVWSNLLQFTLSDLKTNQELMKQKVKVMYNLAKSAPEYFLKENHILEYATEISKSMADNTRDQATMKYTEGVLMLAAGNVPLAQLSFQECLYIRKCLFGNKSILVGEIMEFLADLLFFSTEDKENSQRKQAIEYYKQVIKIKENADSLAICKLVKKQLSISLSDTLCKLAGQLLSGGFCHNAIMEAVGCLYRSLDLRSTHLGSSHASIQGILHLLREIQRFRGRRCWPQGMSQLYPEGTKNCFFLWENLPKLDFCSAQSSDTVNTAMCMKISKLQTAKSTEILVLDKAGIYIPGRGKKTLTPILCTSAEEKTQQKAQHTQMWYAPRKQTLRKRKDYPIKTLSLGEKNGLAGLSRQRFFSAECESGDGPITAIYHQPLRTTLSANPWESISELISEKWLFHSPQYSFIPQKSVLPKRSQIKSKWLKISSDTDKE